MQNQKRKIKFLTHKQVRQIIEGVGVRKKFRNVRDIAIIETLFSTGLRVSECLALPEAPFASFKGQTFEMAITGKGGYQRTVYFSPSCLKAIREYIQIRMLKSNNTSTLLFPLTVRAVEYMVKRRAAKVGIECHPHTLRHSLATDMLNKGVNIFEVKEFLGHRSITSTQEYLHATNAQLKNIHSKLYK